jgi:hypothetical protein
LLLRRAGADQVTNDLAMPTRVCRGAWVFRAPTTATNSSPARTARMKTTQSEAAVSKVEAK